MSAMETVPSEKRPVAHAEEIEALPLTTAASVEEEKALLLKLDLHILPPLVILFLLAFLDRVNIGNAKIQHLTQDLHMVGHDYSIALFIFFIPYILLEVPSNIIIRLVAPSTWLCSIMFLWGVITICQGLVKSFAGLVVCRFLLGAFEAGFVPGSVYLISMYYKRYELQRRMSIFFCSGIFASALGGLLAYAIVKMNKIGGYAGWRWIFILEGLLTVVVAIIFKFLVVDWPESCTFLTEQEKAMLLQRLKEDSGDAKMDKLDRRAVKRIAMDWKIWVGTLMYMGVVNTSYSTSFFIPTIIQEMGFTAAQSQVRSIPIFVAAAGMALLVAWSTDMVKHRYGFCMAGVLVGSIGYVVLLCQENVTVGVRYMACFFVTVGGYMTQPVTWVWLSNNVSGHYKRAVAIATQIGVGNLGGIVASNIFIQSESPKYKTGYGVSLAMLCMCGVMCTVFLFGLMRENKIRERGGRDYRYAEEGADNLGDDWPGWRFGY